MLVVAAAAAAVAVAVLPVAMSPATNYDDPRGPRFGGAAPASVDPAPQQLDVVSFNVRFALRADLAGRLLRTHPDLRRADVVALQEMDAPGAARIAQELGLSWVYYPVARHPGGGGRDFGNAVLSRWPIVRDRKLLLPGRSIPRGMLREAVVADLEAPPGHLRVYSVHLETPIALWPAARREQLAALCADARTAPGAAVIAGDFNGRAGAGTVLGGCGFAWPTRDEAPTVGFFAWDHVFARGLPEAAGTGVAEALGASDHRPVWVSWPAPPLLSTAPRRSSPPAPAAGPTSRAPATPGA